MPAWCAGVRDASGPIYVAIVLALERGIAAGLIGEGERLPAQRRLAAALGVDLTTVTRAYSVAAGRGLIHATVGRGSFVRHGAAAAGRT